MRKPVLYDYWRSSAAYRVRIALKLKGVEYETRPVDLLHQEQASEAYRAINPQGLIPTLEIDGQRLTQSLAIINYLDIRYPSPPLIPSAAAERAHVVALAMAVACDIHPLNNLRVLRYLKGETALEAQAAPKAGQFLWGNGPTGADVCLVPQLYNARRFNVPIDDFPTLLRAEANANALEAFAAAHPDRQEVPA
jgi:glutathione S-transferase